MEGSMRFISDKWYGFTKWWNYLDEPIQIVIVIITSIYLLAGGVMAYDDLKKNVECKYNKPIKSFLISYPIGCFLFTDSDDLRKKKLREFITKEVKRKNKLKQLLKDMIPEVKPLVLTTEKIVVKEKIVYGIKKWPKDLNDFCAQVEEHRHGKKTDAATPFDYHTIDFKECKHMLYYMEKTL